MLDLKKRVIFLLFVFLVSCTFTGFQSSTLDSSISSVEAQKAFCQGDFDYRLTSGELFNDVFNEALEKYVRENNLVESIQEKEEYVELKSSLREFLSQFKDRGIQEPFESNGLTYEKLYESIPSEVSELKCATGYFETYLVTGLDNFIDAKKLFQMIVSSSPSPGYTPYGMQEAFPDMSVEEIEKMYSPEVINKNFKHLLAKYVPSIIPSSFCEDLSEPGEGAYSCPSDCSKFVSDQTTNLPQMNYDLLLNIKDFVLTAQPKLRAATTDTMPVFEYILEKLLENFAGEKDFSFCEKYVSDEEYSAMLHKLDKFIYNYFTNVLNKILDDLVKDIMKDFYFVHVQRCGCFEGDAVSCPVSVKRA